MLGYKVPSSLHDDSDVMAFASSILGDVPNGRLHKQLVETGKASQVFTFGETGYAPGLQYVGAIVKKGEPLEPVRAALTDAVENFGATPPTKEEMARVRRMYENDMERSLNDPQRVGVALSETIALGDWRLFFTGRERIKTITADEVAGVAKRYFKRDNRVTGTFLPEDAPQRAIIPPAPSVESILEGIQADRVDPGLGRLRADPGQHHEAHAADHGARREAGPAGEEEPRRSRHGRPAPAHGRREEFVRQGRRARADRRHADARYQPLHARAAGRRIRPPENRRRPDPLPDHARTPGRGPAPGRARHEGAGFPGQRIRTAAPAVAGRAGSEPRRAAGGGRARAGQALRPVSERRRAPCEQF